MVEFLLIALVFVAILAPFVVVPELLERWGYDPKSRFVRMIVWATFLILVLVPAALSGFLATVTSPGDWLILAGAVLLAVFWEYYRLHPGQFP
jgi:small-conductance mechanosensitive channel